MIDLVFIRFKILLREYIDSKANVPVRVNGVLEKEPQKMQGLENAGKEMGLSDTDDKPLEQNMFKVV